MAMMTSRSRWISRRVSRCCSRSSRRCRGWHRSGGFWRSRCRRRWRPPTSARPALLHLRRYTLALLAARNRAASRTAARNRAAQCTEARERAPKVARNRATRRRRRRRPRRRGKRPSVVLPRPLHPPSPSHAPRRDPQQWDTGNSTRRPHRTHPFRASLHEARLHFRRAQE